ncbi:MAG: hypothetical protein OHK0052_23620 [Anaerolineales bacterium]
MFVTCLWGIHPQGPKTYYVNLAISQKVTQEVEPGKYTYTYTYTACGGTQKGTINIKSAETLKLPACKNADTKSSSTKLIKVRINNKTGGVLTLRLTGPKSYYFTFQPGVTNIDVVEGKYSYTVYGCGGSSKSGTIKLKPGFEWSWFCR